MKQELKVTATDYQRLSALLDEEINASATITTLEEKLANAAIIEPEQVPEDLITMNSTVVCSMKRDGNNSSNELRTMTLAYPREANIADGRISVFAPLGAELLGKRTGQVVSWTGSDGLSRQMVISIIIYQPEANGDWHR